MWLTETDENTTEKWKSCQTIIIYIVLPLNTTLEGKKKKKDRLSPKHIAMSNPKQQREQQDS